MSMSFIQTDTLVKSKEELQLAVPSITVREIELSPPKPFEKPIATGSARGKFKISPGLI
jgi:hypothetical protein